MKMAAKGQKSRVSKVKSNNQTRNKLTKQGKIKSKRNKKAVLRPVADENAVREQQPEYSDSEESDHGQGMLEMVEKDDLAFLKQAVMEGKSSYSILKKIHYQEIGKDVENVSRKRKRKDNDSDDDGEHLENEYEIKEESSKDPSKRTKHLLPIKTKQGLVKRSIQEDIPVEPKYKPVKEQPVDDGYNEPDSDAELMEVIETEELDYNRPVSTAELLARRQNELQKQKFRIGVLCSGLLECPELKIRNFVDLLSLMDEKRDDVDNLLTIRKIAAVSVLEVFKDVLPEYQIKHQDNTGVKLKKDTLQLQSFEMSLITHYKKYLQKLEKMASVLSKKKGDNRQFSPQELKLGEVAIRCMGDLLVTHPYFNFAQNVAQMLIPFLDHRLPSVRELVKECCKQVFKQDKRGEISFVLVRRINHIVKARANNVHCDVLECLLALRIRDVNLDAEKEEELKNKKFMTRKQKLLKLSKRERKRNKKLEELEKEMLETKAEENKQSKHHQLTEITKIVFMIYFRILKKAPSSKLLSVTLEGLAKFANVINLEFYSDLVDVLDGLMRPDESTGEFKLGYREQLHCIQTVFIILSGQGDVLNIDPLRFYTHLYRNLLVIHAGRNHGDLPIILHTLSHVLVKRRKKLSQARLLSFLKRLGTLSLQVQHNGALGCLGVIKTVMQLTKSADLLLDTDSSLGSGKYDPYLMEPEYCNSGSTALYELKAASRHYHPTVRKVATHIMKGVPASGEGSLNPEIGKLSPEQLFKEFDGSEMCFKPAIPVPKKAPGKAKPGKHIYLSPDFENYCKLIASKQTVGPFNFSQALNVRNK